MAFQKKKYRIMAPRIEENPEEQSLLEKELSDVKPLRTKKTVARKNGPRTRPQIHRFEEEKLLTDFVNGKFRFNWSFHPDYHQGGVEEHNSKLIRRLRRGEFSVQAQLDLHGLTQVESLAALENFLIDCRKRNVRCVRIIHGKGNNSKSQMGILRQKVPIWLRSRRFSRQIVAFTSAQPKDGGMGATYVLLRKNPEG